MEKKLLALLLTVMLVFSAFGFNFVSSAAQVVGFPSGSGTEADPWQIESAFQLDNVRNYLGPEHHDKYFILINDINLDVFPYNEGAGWNPIGDWWGTEPTFNDFQGTFDGDGHTISGLFINMPAPVDDTYENTAGLFGEIYNATIRNVVLSDVNISGQDCVGGIVGCAEKSFISGVTVSGIIAGWGYDYENAWVAGKGDYVGGIAGYFYIGTITGVQGLATVTGNDLIGGLVGYTYQSTISNSFAQGSATGGSEVGGLVGYNDSSLVINSLSTSSVAGDESIGGLVGYNNDQSTIIYSHANGAVTGNEYCWYAGGLVGSNSDYSTVIYSHADGSVAGGAESNGVGGLVGDNSSHSTISKSFATGDVSGEDQLGGLVGENSSYSDVINTYASGDVSSINDNTGSCVGGLVGVNESTVSTSYAVGLVAGSGYRHGGIVGSNYQGSIKSSYSLGPDNGDGTVVTEGAMKMEATFSDWDFVNVWGINEGSSYPYFLYSPVNLEIEEVTPLADINVGVGTSLAYVPLPGIVQVSLYGGTSYAYLPVMWDGGTPAYNGSTNGEFSFKCTIVPVAGIANTDGCTASVNVIVDDREIVSVATLPAIDVSYGTLLEDVGFPYSVQVTLDDGSQPNLKVTWDGGSPEYSTTSGIYSFTGTIITLPAAGIVNTSGCAASVDVIVGLPDKEIVSVESLSDINVSYDTQLGLVDLPTTVQVTLDDDNTTDVSVTWDGGTPNYNGTMSGTYAFKGDLVLMPGIANTSGCAASVNVIVGQAITPPAIISHPVDCSVPLGESATFTVEYSGYPEPDIQWQLSTNNGKKWSNISGATFATYSFTVTTINMNGYKYRAILNNGVGDPVTTNIATLTVTYGNADVGVNLSGLYDSNTNVITWTITVTNNGPDTARGVMISDVLINGTKVQAVYSESSHKLKGRTVTVNIGDLISGESTDIIIDALVVRAPSPVENTVTVTTTSQDGDSTNNASTFMVY